MRKTDGKHRKSWLVCWLAGSLARQRKGYFIFVVLFAVPFLTVCAQTETQQDTAQAPTPAVAQAAAQPQAAGSEVKTQTAQAAGGTVKQGAGEAQTVVAEEVTGSDNVTLDFKEADIRNVLKIISYKAGVNIVTTPEVIGNVTIRLVDVPWEKALDVILKTYGFGYERQGNIIMVAPIDKLTAMKKQEGELAQVQETVTEVFDLKYLDAQDTKKVLEPQLSVRGKITVLEMTGQAGWQFGSMSTEKRERSTDEKKGRAKILIVTDIPPVLARLKQVLEEIDVKPQQVLIEARIMEVDRDRLKDIGLEVGTGINGATNSTVSLLSLKKQSGLTQQRIGGNMVGSAVKPSGFNPLATDVSGSFPYNLGMTVLFQKLNGMQFETMLHALEEDARTNTLSAPHIMTLNNQEATILIGTRYPILKTEVAGTDSTTTTVTLDFYQDIGIQLNVAPQIGANNYINMVVHPAVTSFTNTLGDNKYPIIETREAETRILMKDGETVVIGGLLKDIKSKSVSGLPFLSHIPIIGWAFKRETIDTGKLDLLVFISAHIVKDNEFSPEEIAKLEERMERGPEKVKVKGKSKAKAKIKSEAASEK